jgi:hypothetical protein
MFESPVGPAKIRVYIYIHMNKQMLRWARCFYNFHKRMEQWTLISSTLKESHLIHPDCLAYSSIWKQRQYVPSKRRKTCIRICGVRSHKLFLIIAENLKSRKEYEYATFQTRRSLGFRRLLSSLCLFTANINLLTGQIKFVSFVL